MHLQKLELIHAIQFNGETVKTIGSHNAKDIELEVMFVRAYPKKSHAPTILVPLQNIAYLVLEPAPKNVTPPRRPEIPVPTDVSADGVTFAPPAQTAVLGTPQAAQVARDDYEKLTKRDALTFDDLA